MKRKEWFKYGWISLGAVLLFLWLAVVVVENPNLPANELAGRWAWFYGWGAALATFGLVTYACYPAAWQRVLREVVSWSLISLGIYEGVDGLMQIYGYSLSNHSLYALTGTFYNPGPYSGYLAMVVPIAFYQYLRLGKAMPQTIGIKVARGYALLAFLLCLCALPSGMSRSAWLAASGGIGVVAFAYVHGRERIVRFLHANRKRAVGLAVLLLCLALLLASGAFYLKKDSANGRLLMWKVTSLAIADKPLWGTGESFPKLYGEAQERYFAQGNYTEEEARVAGSPEYAFNEYLQVAAERGLIALFLGLALGAVCLFWGMKEGKYGLCGALVSLGIFSMGSYPSQFPAFWAAGIALLAGCLPTRTLQGYPFIRLAGMGICVAGLVGAPALYLQWKEREAALEKWNNAKLLYHTRAYEAAQTAYKTLYKEMNWNYRYLFEYGHILSKRGAFSQAIAVLQEAEKESNDPMILNIKGKCFQGMKQYAKAETCYKRSVHRLPSRIYPYYLLAKLYAEPDYDDPEKAEKWAKIVLAKAPKVPSPAVEEMKQEMRKLLQSIKNKEKRQSFEAKRLKLSYFIYI